MARACARCGPPCGDVFDARHWQGPRHMVQPGWPTRIRRSSDPRCAVIPFMKAGPRGDRAKPDSAAVSDARDADWSARGRTRGRLPTAGALPGRARAVSGMRSGRVRRGGPFGHPGRTRPSVVSTARRAWTSSDRPDVRVWRVRSTVGGEELHARHPKSARGGAGSWVIRVCSDRPYRCTLPTVRAHPLESLDLVLESWTLVGLESGSSHDGTADGPRAGRGRSPPSGSAQ